MTVPLHMAMPRGLDSCVYVKYTGSRFTASSKWHDSNPHVVFPVCQIQGLGSRRPPTHIAEHLYSDALIFRDLRLQQVSSYKPDPDKLLISAFI